MITALPAGVRWRLFMPDLAPAIFVTRPAKWRERMARGLIWLASKLIGFADEESFARVRSATQKIETDVGSNRVPQFHAPILGGPNFFIGKTSGSIAKGATTGSVTVWDSTTNAASLAATSVTLSNCYCPWAAVGATKWVFVIQMNWAFLIICAEC